MYYNQLPNQHSIVFATNKQRPDFLNTHANVNAPTIELVSHPTDPYVKLLLVMGRDDNDLITAVNGIARGQVILEGIPSPLMMSIYWHHVSLMMHLSGYN